MSLAVLVVEDDVLSRMLVTDLLEESGHRVHAAFSVQDCRRLVRELPRIDIILVDLSLPDGSGLGLLAELLAGPLGPVPVVAYTAHAFPEDIVGLLAAGFCAVLTKPINTLTFVAEIERLAQAGSLRGNQPS
ncbi:MAG: response regulator [Polyangia bacterium]